MPAHTHEHAYTHSYIPHTQTHEKGNKIENNTTTWLDKCQWKST